MVLRRDLYLNIWKWKFGPYELAACGVILLNACLRLALIYLGWPESNSDEATVGLMAMHIAYQGAHPIFFYGQGYMGSLEAYLGAALFFVLGPTVASLRVGVLLLFTLFLLCMYVLTSLLYHKRLALITLALISLGSPEILTRESLAQAGHPETPLFCALIVLFTTWLALSAMPAGEERSRPERRRRAMLYGLWGLLVGAALWNDPLAGPYLLLTGVFLALFCRYEMRWPERLGVSCGFILGVSPTIIYTLTVPLNQGSLAALGFLFNFGQHRVSFSLFDKFLGATVVSLPVATGANAVCSLRRETAWPLGQGSPLRFFAQQSAHDFQCTLIHGGWGWAMLVLWGLACWLAIRAFGKPWYRGVAKAGSAVDRRAAALKFAHLVMLGGAGLSFLVFMLSSQSTTDPWPNSRYLVALVVAVPAMLWPLCAPIGAVGGWQGGYALLKQILTYGVLLIFAGTLVIGTVATFGQVPVEQAADQQQQALVQDLLQRGATRIYSEYWTCDLVMFLSHEKIMCAVLGNALQPGVNRYLSYKTVVDDAPHPFYVFQLGSAQSEAFRKKIAEEGLQYQHIVAHRYDIFQPLFSATALYAVRDSRGYQ